jgi:hypothetical protein
MFVREKKIRVSFRAQDIHRSSTVFPQLDQPCRAGWRRSLGLESLTENPIDRLTANVAHTYPLNCPMKGRVGAAALTLACLLLGVHPSEADDNAALLRVFLRDGASLVSYGEFARVGDRVVFSIPTASTPNPPLQLVNIPADRVDWDRTNRYSESARASRYVATRAEDDYVVLSNSVARALQEVAFTADPTRRLAIVESARKQLAEWPASHFNYKLADVRQMLSMLDEAIADLRAASGGERFSLSLVTLAEPVSAPEPLLPAPTPKEAIEQLLTALGVTDSAVERKSLLTAVVASIDREKAGLPRDWAAATRARAQAAIAEEVAADRSYQAMIRRMISLANVRARNADVRGIRRVLDSLRSNDEAMGRKRPDAVKSAVAAVEAQLDAARRLRLARDRWALRAEALREYDAVMGAPLLIFRNLQGPLEDIKELAGSSQASLTFVERQVKRVLDLIETIVPPPECKNAHTLLISAAHLAQNAAKIRREAVISGEIARAWDASSAAAGALMLSARAAMDLKVSIQPPQLP